MDVDTSASAEQVLNKQENPSHLRPRPRLHKRAPQRPPTLQNDIYVSRKSSFPALLKRADKLFGQCKTDTDYFTIHSMGAAMNKGIELALKLKEKHQDVVQWTVTTSTVDLVDDVEPDDEMEDLKTQAVKAPTWLRLRQTGRLYETLWEVIFPSTRCQFSIFDDGFAIPSTVVRFDTSTMI
ncbi:ribonucleases P/MRP protein subunit pop7 [Quaeritorhiza haematococci]|nr:ribonucleases P/MRP protein subunit pop7 [Quaeritorhiza haematococci]